MKTIEQLNKPYIDVAWYEDTFKPFAKARTTGNFDNIEENRLNFDAFVTRASEFVDRLVNNKVTDLGGIDFVPTIPKVFLQKATACFIQKWFLSGYMVAEIDNLLSIGSFSFKNAVNTESLRKIIPIDALINVQKSGMWDKRVFGIDITKTFEDLGFGVEDILTIQDALDIFQQKGQYDDNFHADLDFTNELTNDANLDRYVKIGETTKDITSFEIMGGSSDEPTKAYLSLNKATGVYEAFIYSLDVNLPDYPKFFYRIDGSKISLFVKVKDNTPESHFLISNVYADEKGQYKVMGSLTSSAGLTEINRANILKSADVTLLTQALNTLTQELALVQGQLTTLATQNAEIPAIKARITALETLAQTHTTQLAQVANDLISNGAKIIQLRTDLEALKEKAITKDGAVAFDAGFIPAKPQDPTTKKYVDDLFATITASVPNALGFEASWGGSLAIDVKVANDATTPEDEALEIRKDLTQISATKGRFDWTDGRWVKLTFEITDENTIDTYIGNHSKFDTIEISTDLKTAYKANISSNGLLRIRKYNVANDGTYTQTNITSSEVKLTRVFQVNGISSQADLSMDDASILALEGVTI